MTNERILMVVLIVLILGAAIYFTVTKFKQEIKPESSSSPAPSQLTFHLTQSPPPSAQPQPSESLNSPTPQPPSSIQGVTAGPTALPQPAELPLLRNKRLDRFPGMLSEEELKNKAVTLVTSKGNIVIEIYPDSPKAASNFLLLASNGFYDNLTFHRVESGLLTQGGDPKGDGTGDAGYIFEDEVVNRDYTKGTVAMANRGPNTNSSQFFIVISDNVGIPKQYTIFGTVIFGMDVVERIAPKDIIYKAVVQPLR